MAHPHEAVILLAFGGPRSAAEVRPFVESVARGRPIPRARLEEVISHYRMIGGASPINHWTFRQARSLEQLLARKRQWMPVYVGMRSWHPFIAETLVNMGKEGIRRALGIVLSPQRTEASYQRYLEEIERASREMGEAVPTLELAPAWHSHPLFIAAQAKCAEESLARLSAAERAKAHLLFTAHSVPRDMARESGYEEQVEEGASMVAKRLGFSRWSVAYQSRSGPAQEKWLEPAVEVELGKLSQQDVAAVVVIPIGFVCDHVEILFDLDVQARDAAVNSGIRFVRAPALNDRPAFIEALAEIVSSAHAVPRSHR